MEKYHDDPVGYARDVLDVTLWPKQAEILQALGRPPYRVLVKSGHNLGKTFLAAVLVNWWYDTRNPGAAITTAPTARDVRDLLWKEVRILRGRQRGGDGFSGTSAPLLQDAPDHYAKGFTAERGESFQGRHDRHLLFVFDEAVGIAPIFWETTKTMFKPEEGHAWLAIFNPTDTTSAAYMEEQGCDAEGTPLWHVISMSALDHPNIAAELSGHAPPYPAAVSVSQLGESIVSGSSVVTDEPEATDIEWTPGSGVWYRPGPVVEARWLGRWPSAGTFGVWSDALWIAAKSLEVTPSLFVLPTIGCDVARYGEDDTSMHVRRGAASLHHEHHNGWSVPQTAGRLKQLCREYAMLANRGRESGLPLVTEFEILIVIDDDGVGGGVTDILMEAGYRVRPVRAGSSALNGKDYPNMRSQLWFDAAELARMGRLSVAQLPLESLRRLQQQLMAVTWKVNTAGQREVEKKDDTRKKIKRSPDDADAFNLAYLSGTPSIPDPRELARAHGRRDAVATLEPTEEGGNARRRGLYGR